MDEQVVVVGVDGSPASYTALRWALAHAAHIGAQVHAVRCWTPIVASRWEAALTSEPVPPEAVQEARAERELAQVVAAAVARVPVGAAQVAVRQSVVRGPAGPVLVSKADGATLLAVGHGPRATELLHRSVTWYCVRHATCPVLVIPPTMATRRTLGATGVYDRLNADRDAMPDVDTLGPGDRGGARMTTAPVRPVPTSTTWPLAAQGLPAA